MPPTLDRWARRALGTRGSVVDYWMALADADPTLGAARVCVEVVVGDATILAASEPVRTTGSDGTVYVYEPLLIDEPEFDQRLQLGSRQAATRTIAVSLLNLGASLSEVLASGKPLSGFGEVSLQVDGGNHDLRLVLIRGDLSGGVRFRRVGEPVSLTISDPRETRSGLVPPLVVDLVRWPLAHESAIGSRIPRVYNDWTDVPALRVRDDFGVTGLYFAACDDPVRLQVSGVKVNGVTRASGDATYPWAEVIATDGRGARVLCVAFSGAATWVDGDTVHITVARRSGVDAMGVLDVVTDLLRQHTDLGPAALRPDLFAGAGARLGGTSPAVLVNASGGQTVAVTELLGHLLAGWPSLHLVYEAGGLGPVILDRRIDVAGRGVEFVLSGGSFPLLDRLTLEELPKEDVQNSVEVRYGYGTLDDRFTGVLVRNPDNSARCALSADLSGRRPGTPLDLQFVKTEADAANAADWYVEHLGFQPCYVEWTCPAWAFVRFRRGMTGLYTDPDVPALTSVRAVIVRVSYRRGACVLGLLAWVN